MHYHRSPIIDYLSLSIPLRRTVRAFGLATYYALCRLLPAAQLGSRLAQFAWDNSLVQTTGRPPRVRHSTFHA